MITWNFYTINGRFLASIVTDDPFAHVGELAQFHSVDADEIEWEINHDPN